VTEAEGRKRGRGMGEQGGLSSVFYGDGPDFGGKGDESYGHSLSENGWGPRGMVAMTHEKDKSEGGGVTDEKGKGIGFTERGRGKKGA